MGEGWANWNVRLTINGQEFLKLIAIVGVVSPGSVQPVDGAFQVEASLPPALSGAVEVEAREMGGLELADTAQLDIPAPPGIAPRS